MLVRRIGASAACLIVCACVFGVTRAHAQPSDIGGSADAGPPSSGSGAARPPQIVRLAAIELEPQALPPAASSVDVIVRIESDGSAWLDDPLEPGPLRAAIEACLRQSEFLPAQRDGAAVASRVRFRLRLAVAPAPASPASAGDAGATAPASVAESPLSPAEAARAAEPAPDPPSYGARGRVELLPATGQRLELREMRDLPGAFGDPFRVLDALPGVVPVFAGVPYVYVRGSPPAGTVYYYDGIQVPALFHLALGPAVVHPALVGGVDFYPSVAPARFGRYTGGVLSGGPRAYSAPERVHGELELRLVDLMGMIEIPVAGGSFTAAGRYGYPGPTLSLLSPEALLAYWDYQTRLVLPLGGRDRFEFTWFGSFDRAGSKDPVGGNSLITLEFHRAEARLIHRRGNYELGSALQLGFERSQIDDGLSVNALRIGPRVYGLWHGEGGMRLRVGADLIGTVGSLDAPADQDEASVEIRVPMYADVAGRSVAGVYGELTLPLPERFLLELGLRGDMWLSGSSAQYAVDPRITLTYRSHDWLEWHVASGLGHQPAVFLIPLPGIADVGLDHGLQRAVQNEAGVAVELPEELRLESQFYLQYLTNMIFPDLELERSDYCDLLPPAAAAASERCNRYPRSTGWAYGWEVFLHRAASERISGWLSYTLGWARAHAEEGFSFTPSFDVRHVANLVLQYRIGGGFSAGARLHARSGKMAQYVFVREEPVRYEQRLPAYFRADLQLAYGWATHWGRLRVSLEWFNATLAREPTDIQCRDGVDVGADPLVATPCRVIYAPAIFFPNLGLRGEF